MRFRIDVKNAYGRHADSGNVGRFDVLVDGQRRGLTAIRDQHGYWSADIIGVPLVQNIWSPEKLVRWLQEHVDADVLAPRIMSSQTEMEI